MIRYLAALLLVCTTAAAQAQVVTFRSGEHPAFSRLVLSIPPGAAWRLGRAGSGYALEIGTPDIRYDTSAAFDRIPRDRIAALDPTAGRGRLGIALACDCHAEAFLWRADRLVIDIVDGPAPTDAAFERPIDSAPSPPDVPASSVMDNFTLPLTGMAAPGPAPVLDYLPDTFLPTLRDNAILSATERALAQSLARAASQGLLDLDPAADLGRRAAPPPPAPATMAEGDPPAPAPQDAETGPLEPRRPGLATHSGLDPDPRDQAPAHSYSRQGQPCIDPALLAVSDWAEAGDFNRQLGDIQSRLTAEFDTYMADAALDLARFYIHFGFGREALQALALDDQRDLLVSILSAMARIVDGEPLDASALLQQEDCGGAIDFWLALARESSTGLTEGRKAAMIAAYRALPDALRGHLGAQLSRILLQDGDALAAESVIVIAQSGLTADVFETNEVRAEIVADLVSPERAIATFAEIARRDERATPEAIARLLDLLVETRRPVDASVMLLAETLMFEHRGTPSMSRLVPGYVDALIAADRFGEAIAFLEGDLAPVPQEIIQSKRSDLVTAASERMGVADFLALAFGTLPERVDDAARAAVARRLDELGFADEARRILAGVPGVAAAPTPGSTPELAPELAPELVPDAARALPILTDPEVLPAPQETRAPDRPGDQMDSGTDVQVDAPASPEATATNPATPDPVGAETSANVADPATAVAAGVGAAQAASAAPDGALSVETVLPASVDANTYGPPEPLDAWQSGDWERLAQTDDPLLRAAAEAMRSLPAPTTNVPPLAVRRNLLAEAGATRALAEELLRRFPVDADPVIAPLP